MSQIRIGLENDPTVSGSVNKIYVGTETRDLYGMTRNENTPSWNVSTYVDEFTLAQQLSQLTQKSIQKTKKYPLNDGMFIWQDYKNPIQNYNDLAEELQLEKVEVKKKLEELKQK